MAAGVVAGNVSKIEKKAGAKAVASKAISTGKSLASKALAKGKGAAKKVVDHAGGDPLRVHSLVQGAAIGGATGYAGQKSIQEYNRRKRAANKTK